MPELIYPTSTKIRGPILIDGASLQELDSIITTYLEPLQDLQRRMIEERLGKTLSVGQQKELSEMDWDELKKRVEGRYLGGLENESRSIVLYFYDGSRLNAESFSEAATHAEVSYKEAIGFDLSVQCGVVSLRMNAESDSLSTELTLYVSPRYLGRG